MPFIQSFEELIEAIAAACIAIPPGTTSSRHISHPFLLKGLANGWWDSDEICSNPNLQWEWIEEHLDDADIGSIIRDNRTISWPQLESLISIAGYPEFASNPIMPFSYILEHPDIDWDINEVVEREDYTPENEILYAKAMGCEPIPAPRRCTYEMLVSGTFRRDLIDYARYNCSPNIPVERIIYDLANHQNEEIWDVEYLCCHPHLTQEIIENEPRVHWDLYAMQCPNISKEMLISMYEHYKEEEILAGIAFWSHPAITSDMFNSIDTESPGALEGLTKNPNLTWDYIIEHLEMFSGDTRLFGKMLARDDWSRSELIARTRKWTAIRIQRWYRRVTVFDLTFPRAEKKFRLAMEKMYP